MIVVIIIIACPKFERHQLMQTTMGLFPLFASTQSWPPPPQPTIPTLLWLSIMIKLPTLEAMHACMHALMVKCACTQKTKVGLKENSLFKSY
jgi:hypothetical protein